MALPVLLGKGALATFAKTTAKTTAGNVGKSLLGGKKSASNKEEENNEKQLISSTNVFKDGTNNNEEGEPNSIIVRPRETIISTSSVSRNYSDADSEQELLQETYKKVVTIDSLLKDAQKYQREKEEKNRINSEFLRFRKKENELERGGNKGKGNKKSSNSNRIGIFDNILSKFFNFIFFITLGKIFPLLIDILPKLEGIVKVASTIIGTGMKIFGTILDAFIGFVDIGFKTYDKIRDTIKFIGGENIAGILDEFTKNLGIFLNLALIAGMASVSSDIGSLKGAKKITKAGKNVPASVQTRYFKRYGKKKFVQKFGTESLKNLPGSMGRSATTKFARSAVTKTLGRGGTKQALKVTKRIIQPIVKRIPIVGALVDFALNYFVFKESVGKSAFKAIGAGLIGFLGGSLGVVAGPPGVFVGGLLGGLAGDALGGLLYDAIFLNKKPSSSKIKKKESGGIVDSSKDDSEETTKTRKK